MDEILNKLESLGYFKYLNSEEISLYKETLREYDEISGDFPNSLFYTELSVNNDLSLFT